MVQHVIDYIFTDSDIVDGYGCKAVPGSVELQVVDFCFFSNFLKTKVDGSVEVCPGRKPFIEVEYPFLSVVFLQQRFDKGINLYLNFGVVSSSVFGFRTLLGSDIILDVHSVLQVYLVHSHQAD